MKQKTTILLQMIVGFSIILIIVVSANSYFLYRFSSQVVIDKTTRYLLESVIQMSGKIDSMLGEYDRLSLRIALHPATQEYLRSANKQTSDQSLSAYEVQKVIIHEQAYLKNDLFVDFMSNKGELAFYHPLAKESYMEQSSWYPFLDSQGGMFWTTNETFYNVGNVSNKNLKHGILGVRKIKDYYYPSQTNGYMFIVIPMEATENSIGKFRTSRSSKIQVLDQTGRIVYSTTSAEIGANLPTHLWSEVHDTKNIGNVVKKEIDGKEMYISSYTSKYSNWTTITYIDIADVLKDLEGMRKSIIFIGVFGILASLLLTSFFSWSLAMPIRKLAFRLSSIKRGKIDPYEGRVNNKEVAVLYDSFNDMIEDLEKTIDMLAYKQIREKQAQLIAMKAQFQPHFLYNSLNTIYFYSVREKQNKVAQMVLSLSELLRYSIQPGSEFVTLEEDLKQLNRFIGLQRYRYEDKLQIEVHVQEHLLQVPVMKLLLQPIVENAITHGLESVKGRTWLIQIRIAFPCRHLMEFPVRYRESVRDMEKDRRDVHLYRDAEQDTEGAIELFEEKYEVKKNRRVIEVMLQKMESRLSEELSLKLLAGEVYLNPTYLGRIFKEEIGESFSQYLIRLRIEKAKQLLMNPVLKVYEVCEQVGYSDPAHFTHVFKKSVGMTPQEYKMRV